MADKEPRDLRDQLIAEKRIRAAITRCLSRDVYQSISPKLQSEYEADGWVFHRKLKRTIKMRKLKSHDVAFEDRVWAAMAKLDFKDLNKDRSFRLQYGAAANESQQIDVFAADNEVVLVIECKSTATTSTSAFKKDVEAIQGYKPGVIRNLKKTYPNHKIKFILATNNYGVSQETLERFDSADILHMDDEAVEYYLNLAEHLGKAARYQLLGHLFAGQKIPGIESKVPAIEGKMGGYKYYSFAIEPARLLTLSYILHRNKANSRLMPTYQRLIKKSRLQKVTQFVNGGGFFPNSIILNIESKRERGLRFERASQQDGVAKLGILHLPQTYRAAYVIDGQHRLYGYAESPRAEKDLIPVVAFIDLPRADQVKLFMQINENQQAVPKNLRNTLNADLLWDSEDLREQVRALKLRIAQHLGEYKTSPLYGRVIIGENSRTPLRCVTIDAISTGLERSNFIGLFTKTQMKEAGTFYRGGNEETFEALVPFLELCFRHMRDGLTSQWALGGGEGGFVFINNGIESLIRIFSDIVDHLATVEDIKPSAESTRDMFEWTQIYLDSLIAFLNGLTPPDAVYFRQQYGSGGKTKYWRRLQEALRDAHPEFEPAGYTAYMQEQEKKFNTESFEMIRELEQFINGDVRRRLEDEHKARWFKAGVPLKIRTEVTQRALEKNEEREDENEVEEWDCLHLIDYRAIMTQSNDIWQKLFMKQYTRPGEETKAGGWKGRTDWLVELNRIRNQNFHEYVVSETEYEFLASLTAWLVKGQVDNSL